MIMVDRGNRKRPRDGADNEELEAGITKRVRPLQEIKHVTPAPQPQTAADQLRNVHWWQSSKEGQGLLPESGAPDNPSSNNDDSFGNPSNTSEEAIIHPLMKLRKWGRAREQEKLAKESSSQKFGADPFVNPGQKGHDESSSANLPQNIEEIQEEENPAYNAWMKARQQEQAYNAWMKARQQEHTSQAEHTQEDLLGSTDNKGKGHDTSQTHIHQDMPPHSDLPPVAGYSSDRGEGGAEPGSSQDVRDIEKKRTFLNSLENKIINDLRNSVSSRVSSGSPETREKYKNIRDLCDVIRIFRKNTSVQFCSRYMRENSCTGRTEEEAINAAIALKTKLDNLPSAGAKTFRERINQLYQVAELP